MTFHRFVRTAVASVALGAMTLGTMGTAQAAEGRNRAAAIGAIAGAAITLGILGATANSNAEPVYVEPRRPNRPRPDRYRESQQDAIAACREGFQHAAERQGARRVKMDRVLRVEPDGKGHRVVARMTVDYRRFTRTATVTCKTRDGYLVNARAH